MFDFSLGEMLVVALVALVVLGPERLPKAARFAGLWVRKARAQWYSMKHELEQELASEELRRSLRESQEALRETEAQLREATGEAPRAIAPPAEAATATPDDAVKRDD
jgi:sec-independent protein translocase protein TatB